MKNYMRNARSLRLAGLIFLPLVFTGCGLFGESVHENIGTDTGPKEKNEKGDKTGAKQEEAAKTARSIPFPIIGAF